MQLPSQGLPRKLYENQNAKPLKSLQKGDFWSQSQEKQGHHIYNGTPWSISIAPSRPTVMMTSPKVLVLKPASQYVK